MKKGIFVCEHCGGKGMIERYDGKMLREARMKLGLPLREVARRLKYSAAYISDMELGRRNVSDKVVRFLEELPALTRNKQEE